MAITPRHYLDFINQYVKLYHEKRSELEEDQRHLNVGLNKIRETEVQVKELQKSLSAKSSELEAKNAAANAKLKDMLQDQQKAEKEKQVSEELQKDLHEEMAKIAEKKKVVQEDLSKVEPAVLEAQTAVKGIKRQHLQELRTMAKPPNAVQLGLESVVILLGEDTTEWKSIRQLIIKEDFMNRVLNFNTEDITASIKARMMRDYDANPDWDVAKVMRASQACGPLVQWARAQLTYADMLHKVDPLRSELNKLERSAEEKKAKGEEVKAMIVELEQSIGQYKEEYANLIAQAEAIKAGLTTVQDKVNRSIQLLKSLGSERQRWEKSSEGFRAQMDTIVGDVLLSAAFLAYAGYFDQQLRQSLFNNWSGHLKDAAVDFRTDIARTEYLSNPDERLRWQGNALPADDLCTENAVMLRRFNRFPLIIDPSGQATQFLLNEYKDKKITKTSFLDDSFRKNLESALRFGNPLLVQDVESYDPILNAVLNKEVKRTGGRVLITLGDQDIDLSPTFQIFLSTRDPTVEFPADVCSRVTFVNFTVTRSSLQSQCLNQVLKAERPDVDQKRSDLLKLQGEFALRLRQLEKSLLAALNSAKGQILDDDSVISTLETLKSEAAEVARKAAETDVVMAEVEAVSQLYTPLSSACSSIYFTLEQLNQIHFLYQYSLQFFLDIFNAVLTGNQRLSGVTDYSQRLSTITSDIFQTAYNRVSRGMLHEDRITYALLLTRIFLKGLASEPSYELELEHLLRGGDVMARRTGEAAAVKGLSAAQSEQVARLRSLPQFAGIVQSLESAKGLSTWLESDQPETAVPALWEEKVPLSKIGEKMMRLLVVNAVRPDRLLAASHMLVDSVLGEDFMPQAEKVVDLAGIVEKEIPASVPMLLCSVTGYDASGRVDDLATELGKGLSAIAIGSAEGFAQAEKAINAACKGGRWVLLKNVHLAPQWLAGLEKKLHSLQPHPNFRLFLTMEIHPKLPVNLLRSGRILVYEPPTGLKASLLRIFSTIPAARMARAPAERGRLYFVLAWFHALVQERLRYTPLGWAQRYEWSEADFRMAADTLDACVDATAMGRANLPPDKVPWEALRTLLSQCIYGGRIDNHFDQVLLDCFIANLFNAKAFEAASVLIPDFDGHGNNLLMPDGVRREQFVQWAEAIKTLQTPSWLGLPNTAEKVLLTNRGIPLLFPLSPHPTPAPFTMLLVSQCSLSTSFNPFKLETSGLDYYGCKRLRMKKRMRVTESESSIIPQLVTGGSTSKDVHQEERNSSSSPFPTSLSPPSSLSPFSFFCSLRLFPFASFLLSLRVAGKTANDSHRCRFQWHMIVVELTGRWFGRLGQEMVGKLLKMSGEEDLAYDPSADAANSAVSSDARPAWMKLLHESAKHWLKTLPRDLPAMKRTVENIKVARFLDVPDR